MPTALAFGAIWIIINVMSKTEEKAVYVVHAEWDGEMRRWSATSDDIPGLFLEADTIENILMVLDDVASELIEANTGLRTANIPLFLQAHYVTRLNSDRL